MKYDIDLDPQSANTSHVLVLDLVGSGKRVLDVGCATGYLAAALKERGNTVTGVEIDPEAAELARPHLERLVLGDLTELDLTEELGEHGFDVIVFADVLEHVPDPLGVLRQAPGLLAPGGSVVVSIPNVAHGAVRLALLQGRFEYQDLGLLDNTHLRFFTRSSLNELLRLAGLVPVEQRRTVAEPFATEIPVQRGDFSSDVVESLSRDADATTYQFVIRSIVADGPQSTDLAAELVARNEEVNELRRQLGQVTVAAQRLRPPTVGLIGNRDLDAYDELRRMAIAHELRRRLPQWAIECYDWAASDPRPAPDGSAVQPFRTEGGALERSAPSLDCAVLTGSWTTTATDEAILRISDDGCPVHLAAAVGLDVDKLPHLRRPGAVVAWRPDRRELTVADPLLLAGRLVPQEILSHRSALLAATAEMPPPSPGYVLASVRGANPAALGRALDGLAEAEQLDIAVIPDPDDAGAEVARAVASAVSDVTLATEALEAVDLLAAVAAAQVVVTDQPALLWMALAFRRPCIGLCAPTEDIGIRDGLSTVSGWLADPDLVVATPGSLAGALDLARRRAEDDDVVLGATDELDLFADELIAAVTGTGARRLSTAWPTLLAEASSRIDTLGRVNDGLRHRLLKQRVGFGVVARRMVAGGDASVSATEHKILADKLVRAEAEVKRMQEEVDGLVHHIAATDATLTMRTLAPARRFYGRLRNR